MKKGIWLLVIVLAFSAVRARAQVRELTPDESVRLGLAHNARLQAASADVRAAGAALRQVRATRLPLIRTQAGYTRLSSNIPNVAFTLPGTDSTFTFQSVQLNRYLAEASIEQALFTGSRLHNQVRAAEHDERAAELRAQQENADVAYDIRRVYWELYRALAVRTSLRAALERVDAHLTDVRTRLREGAALRRDLLAAQTRRSEVQLERVEAENAVRVGQLELNRLIGLPLDTPVQPAGGVVIDTTSFDLDTLTAAASAQQPQLAALNEAVAALRAQVRASEGERWPQLDLVGRYTYARPNQYFFMEQDRFHHTWELGFSTRWSIWEGGRRAAQTSALNARADAAQARLADARAQVTVDVARKGLEVQRAREALGVAAQNVSEAEETFRVAREQFKEGAALSADVLDAEQAYRQAQSRQAQALADFAIARAALHNSLGRVW